MKYEFDFYSFGQKGSKAKSRRIVCVETGAIYPSLEEAAKENRTYRSNICAALQGRLKTAGGLHWRYDKNDAKIDEEDKT